MSKYILTYKSILSLAPADTRIRYISQFPIPSLCLLRKHLIFLLTWGFLVSQFYSVKDARGENRVRADRGAKVGCRDHFGDIDSDVDLVVLHPLFGEPFVQPCDWVSLNIDSFGYTDWFGVACLSEVPLVFP